MIYISSQRYELKKYANVNQSLKTFIQDEKYSLKILTK